MNDRPVKLVTQLPPSKKPWKLIAHGDRIILSNPDHPAVFINAAGATEIVLEEKPEGKF